MNLDVGDPLVTTRMKDIAETVDTAVAAERERCAKIVEDSEKAPHAHKRHPRTHLLLARIAAAIRSQP